MDDEPCPGSPRPGPRRRVHTELAASRPEHWIAASIEETLAPETTLVGAVPIVDHRVGSEVDEPSAGGRSHGELDVFQPVELFVEPVQLVPDEARHPTVVPT
jgi:hypothetical protein